MVQVKPYELDSVLRNMCILVDTREQKNKHILRTFEARNVPYKSQKLNYGDYSCECTTADGDTVTLSQGVAIERKNSLDELAGNITKGRDRFAREFERAITDGAKMYLMVEGGDWDDIVHHKYRSMIPPNAYMNTVFSWQQKYNITVSFVSKAFAGDYIYGTLFMALKYYLLHGGE